MVKISLRLAALLGLLLSVLVWVGGQPALAQSTPPLPTPDAQGDFAGKTSHRFWVVIDPDPAGLNCRWSPAAPADWYAPDAQFPDQGFGQWPVARQFGYGSVLTANTTPAGFATLSDSRSRPWLKVRQGDNDEICLVRANSRYILPLP